MHILVKIVDVLTDLAILIGVLLCIALFIAVIRDLLYPRSRDGSSERRDDYSDR